MHPIALVARKDHLHNLTSHICPSKDESGPPIVNFVGQLTYHQFSVILSGSCAAISACIVVALVGLHALNYSNPVQQRQVIRICLLVPWVAFFSFLIVWRNDVGEYLVESLDFGCAIALSAFLLFMCDLVLSHPGGFEDLFGANAHSSGPRVKDSPMALRRMWYGTLQFIPTSIFIWISTAGSLAAGFYCKASNSIHFAHIWLAVLKFIFPTIAILSCLQFYKHNKTKLQQHKILLKLFTFKSIIGLNVVQSFTISILSGHNILKPSKYMTYHDVQVGLPSLILACEMPIFAIMMFIAFSPAPYTRNGPAAGPLSAIVDAFNVTDLLSAFVRGPMRLVRDQQKQIMRQDSMKIQLDPRAVSPGSERVKAPLISHAV
ncbi:hypothetical protein HBI56_130860 [Parastagonospora nodorum]|uniref:Uncharacterized protein n=1 Tax=Phaeosphaeria nodorum (strain SN15 / ATCC MYA-4574 / FGSC 10173) TaxID=321614 RepID=A0A7U2I173_PHANO|nr:hypothetical protein HBH56_152960 [Parastagonospora nodorum]QRC96046.1 hypothetical protein JI435_056850 [Parastagonospora nodorum SN15]KAH3926650.1 hypothetical protein HBH54_164730 [Parastagonospora nodorum]KAH3940376.1 hypothetical protein HBH53_217670 [Parastagonospora nodorum]KAH3970274.1 hypothetical protein HBH52_166160 [Parastagonospora nodorum]